MDTQAQPFRQDEIACLEFFAATTVPILHNTGGTYGLLGTGAFFMFGNTLYLVTAKHFLEKVKPEELGVPVNELARTRPADRDSEIQTLEAWSLHPECSIHLHPDAHCDVGAIKIIGGEFTERIHSFWTVLDTSNLHSGKQTPSGYMAPGFPSDMTYELTQDRDCLARQYLRTNELSDLPPEYDAPREHDLVLSYSDEMYRRDGSPIKSAHPAGMSGCAIWADVSDKVSEAQIWVASDQFKVAAIQSSSAPSLFMRATKVDAFPALFRQDDAAVADEIASVFT